MRKALSSIVAVTALAMLLAACGRPQITKSATSTPQGVPVQITLTDYHIASSVTIFKAGQRYHFVLTNQGRVPHEFRIMPSNLGSMDGVTMTAIDHQSLAVVYNFPPGQTRTLDFTFPAKSAADRPQFACYDPGHYELGMYLDVALTP